MSDSEYVPPKVWTWDKESGGRFANINRPISGATHEKELMQQRIISGLKASKNKSGRSINDDFQTAKEPSDFGKQEEDDLNEELQNYENLHNTGETGKSHSHERTKSQQIPLDTKIDDMERNINTFQITLQNDSEGGMVEEHNNKNSKPKKRSSKKKNGSQESP